MPNVKLRRTPERLLVWKLSVSSTSQRLLLWHTVWTSWRTMKRFLFTTWVVERLTFLSLSWVTVSLKFCQRTVTRTLVVTTSTRRLSTGWPRTLRTSTVLIWRLTSWPCNVWRMLQRRQRRRCHQLTKHKSTCHLSRQRTKVLCTFKRLWRVPNSTNWRLTW